MQPILRGRDIKRYSYNWADLWLIATFPSRHYDIDQYPAVKSYLLTYGKRRLSQTGETLEINGKKIKARKKTNNKWFETQDSISYWDDFNKPKILFQEIVQESSFYYDDKKHFFCNDTGRIIVGNNLKFLLGILNSKLFFYAVKTYYGGGKLGENGIRMKHTFFLNFPCVTFNEDINNLENRLEKGENLELEIDRKVYELYGLSEDEINFIESQ